MKSFRVVFGVVCFLIWSCGLIFCAGEIKKKDGIDGNWYDKVTKNIKDSEYEIRWQEKYKEYQSPNRSQNLRFSYYSDGFKVKNRDEEKWSVLFKLTKYGKEDKLHKYNSNVKLEVEKNKGYVKGKDIEIEFENSEKGMRENFVVKEKPKGSGDLMLLFKVERNKVKMDVEKEEIDFVIDEAGGAKVLRYGDLNVTDSKGKKLNGYFKSIDENTFAIIIGDKNAEYPVKIDPLSSNPDWSAGSEQEYAHFGISVSLAGDVNGDGYSDVIVGAYQYDSGATDNGMAFVYHGSPIGLSTVPNWSASVGQDSAYFGFSVSTAGDVNGDGYSDVIIGAYAYDEGQIDNGKSYVYPGSPTGLQSNPIWQVAGEKQWAGFGYSVSTAGDVNGDGYSDVIVGSPFYDGSASESGRAYVYYGLPGGVSLVPNWIGEMGQGGARYGFSVSTAGDVNGDSFSDIIVGAPYCDNTEVDEGCAYAYYGSPGGLPSMPNWTGEGNQEGALFGFSVSTAGDVNADGFSDVIVGAPYYDNGETDEGAAFVYHGSSGGLLAMQMWMGESNQEGAQFGYSVSTAGDVNADGFSDVIVGAPYYDTSGTDNGRAYVYYGSELGVSFMPNWIGESDQSYSYFGISVSNAQDVQADGYSDVIVGAYKYNYLAQEGGAAFAYYGSAEGLSLTPNWTGESNQADSCFGYSVSTVGDVNGDGYSDVIVGAPYYDNGETDEGAAFVYYGSSGGLSSTPDWTAESNRPNAYFGWSVSTAGDVNGDGYSDVVIGAPYYDNGETDEGAVFVYYGSSSGLLLTPDWMAESNQAYADFGYSVSTAGDVNGDGYSDVIVVADSYDNGETNEGSAFVYYGSSSGLSSTPDWTAESNQESAYFGRSVSTAGDVNGDGYSDVIVGAPYYGKGRAFVYYGSATGLSLTPDWMAESNQVHACFGSSVSTAGDVNGDGYSDVVIGAPYYDNGETDEGMAYVYYGSSSGLSSTPNWTAESNQASACFGTSVSTAGDVNGDGYSDVIVGAFDYDNGETDEGSAFVYYGSETGLSLTPDWTAESNQVYACFGWSVSTAGDVNGDGYSDVIVGAIYYDNGQTDEGSAFVYYGNEGSCVPVASRQMRQDYSVPIVPVLLTNSYDSFAIMRNLYSSYGRALVKGQLEVKKYGVPFDATGLYETGLIDLNPQGIPFQQLVNNLDDAKLYKWRFRIKYHLKYGKSDLYSRWYYIQSNALNEADFRTNLDPAQDEDGDGVPNGLDCSPFNNNVWLPPSEDIGEFKITRESSNNFTWVVPAQSTWGSNSVTIDILRSTTPSNFNTATCRATDLAGTQTTFTDTQEPTSGIVWYYLLRIENVCGFQMGSDSNGNPRSGISCP